MKTYKKTQFQVSILFYENQNFLQKLFKKKIQKGEGIFQVESIDIFNAKVDAYKKLCETPAYLIFKDSKNKKKNLEDAKESFDAILNSKVNWVKELSWKGLNDFEWKEVA